MVKREISWHSSGFLRFLGVFVVVSCGNKNIYMFKSPIEETFEPMKEFLGLSLGIQPLKVP